MIINIRCRYCTKEFEIEVDPVQYKRWQDGVLIQNAMPELTADERELLISQFCGMCFRQICGDEE